MTSKMMTVDRYAARCVNLVLLVTRIAVPGARSAPQEKLPAGQGLCGIDQGRALGWLVESGRGVMSPSVRPSAHLMASKYICATSRLSHALASWPRAE